MELNESHVVLPQETFTELNTAAHTDPSLADRAATTAQTFMVFAGLAAGVAGASFGVAKATDWLDERRHKRAVRLHEIKSNLPQS